MKIIAVISALFLSATSTAFAQEAADLQPLTIISGEKTHEFQVELADDDAERQLGLMNRESMAEDRGMLFVYPEVSRTGVWMKNTLIPLDMLFLDTDGTVVAIARNAEPGSLRTIDPGFRVKGFLEINGGQADVLELKPGDIVRHQSLGNLDGDDG